MKSIIVFISKKAVIFLSFIFLISDVSYNQIQNECGTIPAIQQYFDTGVPEPRPTLSGPESTIITNNFKIHYTLSNEYFYLVNRYDSTTKMFADSIAAYAETCWVRSANFGWALPPSDGLQGGDHRYDIYVVSLSYLGVTVPETSCDTPYQSGMSSYIKIHRDASDPPYPKFPRLRLLIAHEFSHACQMRYWSTSDNGETFIFENTSVYMEREIFHDVNDIYLLKDILSGSLTPLGVPNRNINYQTDARGYQYSGGLWLKFLDEYYHDSCLIFHIYECLGQDTDKTVLEAINEVLWDYKGSSLQIALKEYAVWRYFTGTERADDYHFEDAIEYPTSHVMRIESTYTALFRQMTERSNYI